MLFDPNRKVFAVLPSKRTARYKPKIEVGNERSPHGLRWNDEGYVPSRRMGADQSEPHKYPSGVYRTTGKVYDARVLPPESVAVLQDYEDRINALRAAQTAFLENAFQTWPIAKREDFEEPHRMGEDLAVVKAKIKAEKPRSKTEVAAERAAIRQINKVFNGA